ncbi:hypothetical protein [Pyramidobacter sp.]|uniref:hypothetical protein n=1 Tax=Pyramidobacter sp. TaxID=1943581 RepID=UPI003317C559
MSNIDVKESKEERFVRVAESRTNKIIHMIRLLGNCANKNNYEYTETEVKKIFAAIEGELRIAKTKFADAESIGQKFSLR